MLRDLVLAAVKWVPEAWTADERLNTTGLGRHFEKQGYPLSQPTLHRLLVAKQEKPRELKPETIEALHAVLKIPRNLLRGEPMGADTERAISQFGLDVYLLAQKLGELPEEYRKILNNQVEEWLRQQRTLKKSADDANIIPITRRNLDN